MTHRYVWTRIVAAGLALAGIAGGSEAAQAQEKVRIGINGVVSDGPFFIAEHEGFFKQQGISVEFVPFDAGPQMIAPLGVGQIDVAGGASSAGLFNAVARGIDIKIVADRGSTPPGHEYVPILVRKALVDSGEVKSIADLKGRKVAEAGEGGSQSSMLNEALKAKGLSYRDVQHVYLGYPQHVAALSSGAIDASVTTEPSATQAEKAGVAVRFSDPTIYPNQQVAVLLYSGDFIGKRRDVAQRFMVAFLQGARIYNDALKNGRFAGPAAPAVIDILLANTRIKERAIYEAITPSGINPNGKVNLDSLRKDQQFYAEFKYLERSVDLDKVVDHSFVEKALGTLGPYRPRS